MSEKYVILIPQFNDWAALNLLIGQINKDVNAELLRNTSLLIVDDCSSLDREEPVAPFAGVSCEILRLGRNLGHQRAIAVGLSYIASETAYDKVIVMDADGEDAPVGINHLAAASEVKPGAIIIARRTKRQEVWWFKAFYAVYKLLFKLLTGKVISFGNFSLVPRRRLLNLVKVSEIWNNYPGGIIKSRIPYSDVPLERAKRLAGESKMNFVSLVLHGLSAISVLIDVVAVRILIFSLAMSGIAVAIIFFILFLKLIGNATPGWASTLGTTLLIVMLQSFLISLFLVFVVLQYRTQQHFIPALHYRDFIDDVEVVS